MSLGLRSFFILINFYLFAICSLGYYLAYVDLGSVMCSQNGVLLDFSIQQLIVLPFRSFIQFIGTLVELREKDYGDEARGAQR